MIYKLKGKVVKKDATRLIMDVEGLCYEINIPGTVFRCLNQNPGENVELIIYHYINIDKNRGTPIMIGFIDELERDFFEKFIGVSGIGPRAALRAFDKPIAIIAQAIEEGDLVFLNSLAGVGKQKAKQIVAHLQGKVGRFALIKKGKDQDTIPIQKEIVEEAHKILKRLQYNTREAENMIKKVLETKPHIDSVEEFLNEIYRQKK